MVTESCRQLKPSSICFSSVNYHYFAPNSSDIELERRVLNRLSNVALNMLPQKCLSSLKLFVCGTVYLKCQPNSQVFEEFGLNITMPFQRPCLKTCEILENDCVGLLKLLGLAPNCKGKFDYGGGLVLNVTTGTALLPQQFDISNNPSYCTQAENSSELIVGPAVEPYYGERQDIFSGKIFIPRVSWVDNAVPRQPGSCWFDNLLQPEYYQQYNCDSLISAPVWLAPQCHSAMIKWKWFNSFHIPQQFTLGDVMNHAENWNSSTLHAVEQQLGQQLWNYSFYLPSFPSHEICAEYASACKDFISAYPDTAPNCGEIGQFNVSFWPLATEQVVLSLDLFLAPAVESPLTVQLKTSTYYDARTDIGDQFVTRCPTGFVVPTDPDDVRVQWVTGTGCALACRLPLWNDQDYELIDSLHFWLPIISVPFIVTVFIRFIYIRKLRAQKLLLCFVGLGVAAAVGSVLTRYVTGRRGYCESNAVQGSQLDGQSRCISQAAGILYLQVALCLTWFCQTLDLFLTIVVRLKTRKFSNLYFLAIVALPVIPVLIVSSQKLLGYDGILPFCYISNFRESIKPVVVPMVTLIFIGTLLMTAVMIQFARQALVTRVQSTEVMKKRNTRLLTTSLAFVVLFLFLYAGFFAKAADSTNMLTTPYFKTWVSCVFEHYDGVQDSSWRGVCGVRGASQSVLDIHMFMVTMTDVVPLITAFIFSHELLDFGATSWAHVQNTLMPLTSRRPSQGQGHVHPTVRNSNDPTPFGSARDLKINGGEDNKINYINNGNNINNNNNNNNDNDNAVVLNPNGTNNNSNNQSYSNSNSNEENRVYNFEPLQPLDKYEIVQLNDSHQQLSFMGGSRLSVWRGIMSVFEADDVDNDDQSF